MAEELVLRDAGCRPTERNVLSDALGSSYALFCSLEGLLSDMNVCLEWRYYNDGKAWMCKLMYKKRNLAWLNVYDGCFVVDFYFLQRHKEMVESLSINDDVKRLFMERILVSKSAPVRIMLRENSKLCDVATLINAKKDSFTR